MREKRFVDARVILALISVICLKKVLCNCYEFHNVANWYSVCSTRFHMACILMGYLSGFKTGMRHFERYYMNEFLHIRTDKIFELPVLYRIVAQDCQGDQKCAGRAYGRVGKGYVWKGETLSTWQGKVWINWWSVWSVWNNGEFYAFINRILGVTGYSFIDANANDDCWY